MNLFAAPEEEKEEEEEEEEEGEEGKGEEEDMFYLDCVEVAGLDYEKKLLQSFRPSYLPLESKTMVSKTLLL